MRGFWVLVHVLGFTLWLGGGIATMVPGVSAKSFAPAERLSAYKLIGAIQRILVGPGAMAVLLSTRPLHALHEAGRCAGLDGCDDDRRHSGRARRRDDQRADGGKAGAARGGPTGRATGGVSGTAQAPDLRRHDRGRIRADCDARGDAGKSVTKNEKGETGNGKGEAS